MANDKSDFDPRSIMILACCLAALPVIAQGASATPYVISSRESDKGAEVLTISFKAADSPEETEAFLVHPAAGGGAGSAILYLHLYPGTKSEFLQEAKAMAARGITCLLPQGRVPWRLRWGGSAADLDKAQGQMAEYRAALGILRGEPGVKPGQVLVVGHDYGAMYGLALMADDPDIRGGAFLAFAPKYSRWISYFSGGDPLPLAEYDRLMESLDPLKTLGRIRGRPAFLQFAETDRYLSQNDVESIRKAAGAGSVLDMVGEAGATHDNLNGKGSRARMAWLDKMLQAP